MTLGTVTHVARSIVVGGFMISALMASGVAQAALISADDARFGVGSVTRDTLTGLEWLDVTASVGCSYNQVANNTCAGRNFSGWRHATYDELLAFWQNAGITELNPGSGNTIDYAAGQALLALVGIVQDDPFPAGGRSLESAGFYDDGNTGDSGTGYGFILLTTAFGQSREGIVENSFSTDGTSSTLGSWLIRTNDVVVPDVPEPAPLAALAIGLLALAALRRRYGTGQISP